MINKSDLYDNFKNGSGQKYPKKLTQQYFAIWPPYNCPRNPSLFLNARTRHTLRAHEAAFQGLPRRRSSTFKQKKTTSTFECEVNYPLDPLDPPWKGPGPLGVHSWGGGPVLKGYSFGKGVYPTLWVGFITGGVQAPRAPGPKKPRIFGFFCRQLPNIFAVSTYLLKPYFLVAESIPHYLGFTSDSRRFPDQNQLFFNPHDGL